MRVPIAVGIKFTAIEQVAPWARLEPQVVTDATAKSPGLEPEIAILSPPSEFKPGFLSVRVCEELEVPCTMLPKGSVVLERVGEASVKFALATPLVV